MEDTVFDTELFIEEIKSRRSIWDMECADYKNRVLKRTAWHQLVEIFSKEGCSEEQKKILGNTLQKRWKSLRDNFARELRKRKTKKSGSGASNSTPYIYFSRLKFVENTVNNKLTTSNLDDHDKEDVTLEEGEADTEDLTMPEKHSDLPVSNKNIKLNPADKHFSDIIQKSIAMREQREVAKSNEDDDKLFCLSLYKKLKKIPEHGRIRTKIQLLETLQRAQDFYSPTPTNELPRPAQYHLQHQNQHYLPMSNIQYENETSRAYSTQAPQTRVLPAVSPTESFISDPNSEIMDLY
ncbi:hypothetical protein J6590_099264 [Homalodisca vitripennis]|nr:hypothetical protein J6590_099264 [Homalodisca vitripennis]